IIPMAEQLRTEASRASLLVLQASSAAASTGFRPFTFVSYDEYFGCRASPLHSSSEIAVGLPSWHDMKRSKTNSDFQTSLLAVCSVSEKIVSVSSLWSPSE